MESPYRAFGVAKFYGNAMVDSWTKNREPVTRAVTDKLGGLLFDALCYLGILINATGFSACGFPLYLESQSKANRELAVSVNTFLKHCQLSMEAAD